ILKCVLCGDEIKFANYEGLLSTDQITKITTLFYIEHMDNKYKVKYELELRKNVTDKKIELYSEKLTYWTRGATWKTKRSIFFKNPFYDTDSILENKIVNIETEPQNYYKNISFVNSLQNLAVYCAQNNVSLFFNSLIKKTFSNIEENNKEEYALSEVIRGIFDFGRLYFQVVKVNQLGAINNNIMIPVNMHRESDNVIMQGCLPMFMNGHGEVSEKVYKQLKYAIDSINIALKAIIPNLSIELKQVSEEIDSEGVKLIQVDVYSIRDGKKFLTKYESEGIKRIISLLNYLISLYNNPEICLVVDELDSGIFEYLLGELLGVLSEEAKGQLIFTSHNLRVLEKLDTKNIICSTTNPDNRYIGLSGVEKNHNHRDFYIRAIVLGGQKETLYDDTDLQSIGYAFRKASSGKSDVELQFSSEFSELLKQRN
ncbi:ATP-binding protein, partial [Anaerosporobacter sp.]|uniref:ATP-binding protein n=1 Tax=Anaerosporobacter sp. TaxID=1872529 RepID=UPI00286F1168